MPRAVATAVWSEACVWLGEELPREWIRELVLEANETYARNSRFRRALRSNGNRGRDRLWMFTRHWLCALLEKRRPDLYAWLPASYRTGSDLPDRSTGFGRNHFRIGTTGWPGLRGAERLQHD